jgi:hypothetical protein
LADSLPDLPIIGHHLALPADEMPCSARTMLQILRRCLLLVAALAVTAPASAQQSALTVPRNLNQLIDRAAVIVRAKVVSTRVEKHSELSGIDTVVVTMHVKELFKGQAGKTFTFRQYLWDARARLNDGGYRKGQDLLVMMIAPSAYGLSSPAGMQQGLFTIRRDAAGREIAVNGQGNYRLFDGIGAQLAKQGIALSPAATRLLETHRKGPIEVGELTSLIRDLVSAGR